MDKKWFVVMWEVFMPTADYQFAMLLATTLGYWALHFYCRPFGQEDFVDGEIENGLQHWLYGFEVLLLVALFVSPHLQMDDSLWTTLLCIMFFGEIIFIGKSIIPYAVYWHG